MCDVENIKRVKKISDKISHILEICDNGIVKALEDTKLKQPAIIMHLISAKEQLQKIQDSGDIETLSLFSKEDIKGLSAIRNIASHDYDGINFSIIESVIREKLPTLKKKIDDFVLQSK